MNSYIGASTEYSSFDKFVPAPLLRKIFKRPPDVKKITLKIGTPGFYDLYINGKKITKGFLAPYISNPDDYIYFDEYDITEYTAVGENCVGIVLGNGLMNNPGGHVWNFDKAPWRGAPRAAFEIIADELLICESDNTVKTHPSAIIFDDYRSGEYYDARNEIIGWSSADYCDEDWENAVILPAADGEERLCEADPIKIRKELTPISITEYDGGYLYDFGENGTGVCRIKIKNSYKGQEIVLRYGEYIRNGKLNFDNLVFADRSEFQNSFAQKSKYICGGKEIEEHTPAFIYNGFQYVYVTGITEEQATKELLTYIQFNSDLKETGNFTCSDNTVNAIQTMALNSALSCFVYFPNDCPQREKNGWTADVALSAEYTLLNYDAVKSYREWLNCVRKAQHKDGMLPGIIPTPGWGYGHGPAWDGVIVTLPYDIYRYTGIKEVLEENSNAIKKYLGYLKSITDENGIIDIGLGDWCDINDPVCGGRNYSSPRNFTSTVLTMYQFKCASQIFGILNMTKESENAEREAEYYRQALRKQMIDFDTLTAIGNCETSQAMALYYGLFDENEEKGAAEKLAEIINQKNDFIHCGVLGNKVLYSTLSKYGYGELAYKMITRPEFPSFGNYVKRGFTTLPEHFTTKEREKEYRVESLNHHFWGNVTAWFYLCLAGIKYNPDFDDTKYAEISPEFLSKLSFVDAKITTPYGEISVNWKSEDENNIVLKITKPSEVKAKVIAPSGWHFDDGAAYKHFENEVCAKLKLQKSGNYKA